MATEASLEETINRVVKLLGTGLVEPGVRAGFKIIVTPVGGTTSFYVGVVHPSGASPSGGSGPTILTAALELLDNCRHAAEHNAEHQKRQLKEQVDAIDATLKSGSEP